MVFSVAAEAGSTFTLGGYGGYGDASAEQNALASRSMNIGAGFISAGWLWGGTLNTALYGEMRYVGQTTLPDSVSGTNLGGKGYAVGAELTYLIRSFWLAGNYLFASEHNLNLNSTSDEEVKYFDGAGYSVKLGFRLLKNISIFGFYNSLQYRTQKSGNTIIDITNNKLIVKSYGLGGQFDLFE